MYIKKTNKQAILHAKEQQIIKYEMLNIETEKNSLPMYSYNTKTLYLYEHTLHSISQTQHTKARCYSIAYLTNNVST